MSSIQFLNSKEQEALLRNVAHNKRYHLMTVLMLDCGLRVTEVASLKIEYFELVKKAISLPSLKKRSNKPIYRSIPMTQRVMQSFTDYIQTLDDPTPQAWCFPTNSKSGHTSRIVIWRMIKKYSPTQSSPHMLRHTFATALSSAGNDLLTIKELLGHNNVRTTEIYVHAGDEKKKIAIKSLEKRSFWQRFNDLIRPKKDIFLPIDPRQIKGKHVGRKPEMKRINDLYHKRINTIVLGPQGVGKTHLLSRIYGDKILKLDDFRGIKVTLGSLLLKLFEGDKEKIISMLTKQTDINKVVTRESIPQLIGLLHSVTQQQEYTIIIDDLTHITTAGVNALEKLAKHYHIVASARQLKLTQGTFLTSFERIDLKTLSRNESYELIQALSKALEPRITDYEAFKNHVYEQSAGNPLFISELVHRFSKESTISRNQLSTIRHTAALREIDFSIPIVIGLSSLMVLRYLGNEFEYDKDAFRLIGGAFLIFALYGRSVFSYGKRKFI